MPNIFNILGYLKINNEEDAIKYLMNEIDIPSNDHYDILNLDTNHYSIIDNICNTKYGDLTGRKFDKLTVRCLDVRKSIMTRRPHWICDCECGGEKTVIAYSLINGDTSSCGCNHSYNTYDLTSKEYGIGYTRNGTRFLFDKEDYDKISKYKWTNDRGGYITAYVKDESGKKEYIRMHRFVMNVTDPNIIVDHIHHNHADNRKSELRIVTVKENNLNRKLSKNNSTGHSGIYYNPSCDKWRACIRINGKLLYLGSFPTKEEAIEAREAAEKKYFGEYRYQGTKTTDQILNEK